MKLTDMIRKKAASAGVDVRTPQKVAFSIFGTTATLSLHGDVSNDLYDDDGITLADVQQQLSNIDPTVSSIVVDVHSYGGDVHTAYGVIALLDEYAKKGITVTTRVYGIAASAAALMALAYPCTVYKQSTIMVHQSMTLAVGNKTELARAVAELSKVDELQLDVLSRYAKVDRATLDTMLRDETFLVGVDILDYFDVTMSDDNTQTQDVDYQVVAQKAQESYKFLRGLMPPQDKKTDDEPYITRLFNK